MSNKQIFTVTDLGGGDGGKGGVVHKICTLKKAHTVIKVGGGNGSHGVRTSKGEHFNFSHFGCGTFEGTKTHISELMVIEPYRLLDEANRLKHEWRIHNIFDYLTVDENVVCITPFQTITSQLRELLRKDKPKGTVGVGVGETISDIERYPDLVIRVKDIDQPTLRKKMESIREEKCKLFKSILSDKDAFNVAFWESDKTTAQGLVNLLNDTALIDRAVQTFKNFRSSITMVDRSYLKNSILSKDGTVVVESSHGILTDQLYGFHPHVSQLRTLPTFTLGLLKECGYDGEIIKLGVCRAYAIRHGAGPMVTESSEMIDLLLPGSNKDENRWQGKVRVGPIDMVALRYAIEVCGGPSFFDGLAISWFDQIQKIGRWDICDHYIGHLNKNLFHSNDRIMVTEPFPYQLVYQEEIGKALNKCKPHVISHDISTGYDQEKLIDLCSETMEKYLSVPVKMISFGPTEQDKVCI